MSYLLQKDSGVLLRHGGFCRRARQRFEGEVPLQRWTDLMDVVEYIAVSSVSGAGTGGCELYLTMVDR